MRTESARMVARTNGHAVDVGGLATLATAPHNIEAEQALLGAVLVNNEAHDRVASFLLPEHFFDPLHARIYEVAAMLIGRGELADPIAMGPFFETAEPIKPERGPELTVPQYLGRLAAHATTTIYAAEYGAIIVEKAERRQGITDLHTACALLNNPDAPADETLAHVQGYISDLQARSIRNRSADHLEFSSDVSIESLAPYLIKGVLPPACTALLYGASGGGKTFLAIHLGGCFARGLPVFGRRAQTGATLYVALEGKYGFGLRMKAWERINGDLGERFARLKTQVTLGTGPASAAHVSQIIAGARRLSERAGCPVALIVIDTLACALTSDNENDAVTIAAVMAQCDRIKAETGATVLLLHHPGKDATKGPRGSYALRGAVDVMIRIDREPEAAERTIVLDKVRDGPEGPLGAFTLRNVEFGDDEEGDPITSCVVIPSPSTSTLRSPKAPKPASGAAKALTELHELVLAEKGALARLHERAPDGAWLIDLADWRAACARRGLTLTGSEDSERKAFNRAVETLSGLAQIETFGQVVWLIKRHGGTA